MKFQWNSLSSPLLTQVAMTDKAKLEEQIEKKYKEAWETEKNLKEKIKVRKKLKVNLVAASGLVKGIYKEFV